MAGTKEQLAQAFDLIRQDKLEEALIIIRPITTNEPDNADAWWLMANAASDPSNARKALVNALKINPSYPKARDLLDKLNEMHPPNDQELMMMLEIEDVQDDYPVATAPASDSFFESSEDSIFESDSSDDPFGGSSEIDDLFSSTEDESDASAGAGFSFEGAGEETPAASTQDDVWWLPDNENPFLVMLEEDWKPGSEAGGGMSRRTRIIAGVVAAIVVLVCVVAAVMMFMGGEDVDPNADPGALAAVDAVSINAEKGDVLELVRTSAETEARLAVGPDSSAIFTPVSGGHALVVQLCAEAAPDLPAVIMQGMDLAVTYGVETVEVRDLLTMVGVSVSDCVRGDTLYRAMAPIQAATDFNSSQDTLAVAFSAFHESWQVTR